MPLDGRAGRDHRHRLERGADRVGHRRPGAKLSLFQRTAQWIMPQDNPPYTEEEKAEFREDPGPDAQSSRETCLQLFAEGFSNAVVDADSPQMQIIEDLCRGNLEDNVTDAGAAREAPPRLPGGLQAARHLARLLRGRSRSRTPSSSPRGSSASSRRRGPHPRRPPPRARRAGPGHGLQGRPLHAPHREVIGRDGERLDDVWAERPVAYLSISIPGLPEPLHAERPERSGRQLLADRGRGAAVRLHHAARRSGAFGPLPNEISAEPAGDGAFDAERVEAAKKTVWATGCRSWYLDDRGIPAAWPWTFDRFREEMARPKLEDHELVG